MMFPPYFSNVFVHYRIEIYQALTKIFFRKLSISYNSTILTLRIF
jgi:hypothetical protein